MSRRAPLRRGQRLRPVSAKRRAGKDAWDAVYAEVDQRSGGRCEISGCGQRATEHHHTRKPRRSWHHADFVIHLCAAHHRQAHAAYVRGRLVLLPLGEGRFLTYVVTAANKWDGERAVAGGAPPGGAAARPTLTGVRSAR